MNGIMALSERIEAEFQRLLPHQRLTQRRNLSLLIATMLDVRSANLMDLAAGLPRAVARIDMRFQWIWRVLMNPRIEPDGIMAAFAGEVMRRQAANGERLVLIMDQSKLTDRFSVLMVALAYGKRALAVLWRVEQTDGPIGFKQQKELLEAVAAMLPQGAPVCLMADRFYGTAELIGLCQAQGWDYRVRLKGNLLVQDGPVRTTTGALAAARRWTVENVQLTAKKITTSIGIIHDEGHAEPWIIAMPGQPSYLASLGYAARWGIEPMFSDFKSRGFGIVDSQIQYADRLSRLMLVMAIALYVAVCTGEWDAETHPVPAEQNPQRPPPKKLHRSKLSFFTRGLRYLARAIRLALPMPPLWVT